jgi:hypothetical protein
MPLFSDTLSPFVLLMMFFFVGCWSIDQQGRIVGWECWLDWFLTKNVPVDVSSRWRGQMGIPSSTGYIGAGRHVFHQTLRNRSEEQAH